MNEIIQTIAVYALPVIFAITLHEAAHAYVAKYFGDNTAYVQGRMSLNPAKHIDPFGTILLPIIMFAASAGSFFLGYAKPVPVEWGNLKNPKRDMAWVALAGPGANLVMALMWLVIGIFLQAFAVDESFFYRVAEAGVRFNLIIFAFNLFPLPPLDGGRVMTSLLPNRLAYKYSLVEPYGFFIVLGLAVFGILWYWVVPVMLLGKAVLDLIVSPLGLFLG